MVLTPIRCERGVDSICELSFSIEWLFAFFFASLLITPTGFVVFGVLEDGTGGGVGTRYGEGFEAEGGSNFVILLDRDCVRHRGQ